MKNKRGRPKGSRNALGGAAHGADVGGAATSAAKMNGRSGVRDFSQVGELWVPGEGWVDWTEIAVDVERAYNDWRSRCAAMGRRVFDALEWHRSHIDAARRRTGSPA